MVSAYQPNALPNPRAVVIKSFNTIVAYRTVGATGRSVEHASVTILDLHCNAINLNFLDAR